MASMVRNQYSLIRFVLNVSRSLMLKLSSKNDRKEAIYEISDLVYHLLVLMAEMNIDIKDIIKELASRHIIDKKIKQEKMTS